MLIQFSSLLKGWGGGGVYVADLPGNIHMLHRKRASEHMATGLLCGLPGEDGASCLTHPEHPLQKGFLFLNVWLNPANAMLSAMAVHRLHTSAV